MSEIEQRQKTHFDHFWLEQTSLLYPPSANYPPLCSPSFNPAGAFVDVGAESEGWAPCRKKVPNLGWVRWFDLSYYIAIVCYRNLWESIGYYNILRDFDLLPWFAFQYRAKIFEERIQDLWCITRFGLKGFCQCQWCCRILATARDSFAMFCIHWRSMFHPVGLSEKVPPSQDKHM